MNIPLFAAIFIDVLVKSKPGDCGSKSHVFICACLCESIYVCCANCALCVFGWECLDALVCACALVCTCVYWCACLQVLARNRVLIVQARR